MLTEFITQPDILQAFGIAGFLCYITGFASVQLGLMNGNGCAYTLTSLAGATLVLMSLFGAFNLASMLIQISWIIICLVGLMRRALIRPRNIARTP